MHDLMTKPDVLTAFVSANHAGIRLDKFLAESLPEFSRARLQSLIEQGHVTCWGHAASDSSAKVKDGETYCVSIPEAAKSHMEPQAIDLDIVYEDDDLLVINKPAGLTVHPGAGNPDMTLANALLAHCGDSLSGIGGVARPGIVHRIDKDTTGLLVAAKNDSAHLALSAQLADRSLSRTYLALVWGALRPKAGTITGNIDRSFSNRQKMAVVNKGGRPSVTHYEVVLSHRLSANSKPAARTRSACISPISAIRWWAIRFMAHPPQANSAPKQPKHCPKQPRTR
jgi:23S rRNA pseudouridine1911/1915/1917 synthase